MQSVQSDNRSRSKDRGRCRGESGRTIMGIGGMCEDSAVSAPDERRIFGHDLLFGPPFQSEPMDIWDNMVLCGTESA